MVPVVVLLKLSIVSAIYVLIPDDDHDAVRHLHILNDSTLDSYSHGFHCSVFPSSFEWVSENK